MKRKAFRYPLPQAERLALEESTLFEEPALVVNVRSAKDRLSSLLEAAARGDEVVITSDGRPKARLIAVQPRRRPFRMHWSWLRSQPLNPSPSSEFLIREERDGRD